MLIPRALLSKSESKYRHTKTTSEVPECVSSINQAESHIKHLLYHPLEKKEGGKKKKGRLNRYSIRDEGRVKLQQASLLRTPAGLRQTRTRAAVPTEAFWDIGERCIEGNVSC